MLTLSLGLGLGDRLKQKQLKITPQRLAIFNMLCNTTAHPNAETVFKSLAPQYPGLSLATVYKTLDSFCEAGLLQELNVNEGRFRYDANMEAHPHFVCRSCAQVLDVQGISGAEDMRRQVADMLGVTVDKEQLFFYGTCKACLAESN